MEEAKAMAQHQQQLILQHQQQQQQRHHLQQQQQQQQQMLLLHHLQKQQQQQASIPRFQSNMETHLRSQGRQQSPNPNPNPNPNPSSPNPVNPSLQQGLHQHKEKEKDVRGNNKAELQMAYQDAWRICNPDIKRPFTSLEDACERLLPYHVVADFEAEEDDRALYSDTTGQIPSRSQQWDHNIAAKVSEFTATFEKQALAFNMITRKRDLGEFRSEERLMVEQALLQDEKRAMLELRAQIEKAEQDAQAANFQMTAMAMAGRARAESQVHAEMMLRANAMRSQGSVQIGHEMVNEWGNTLHRNRDEEASEDFLNDEEPENGMQGNWREVGKFDLNTR